MPQKRRTIVAKDEIGKYMLKPVFDCDNSNLININVTRRCQELGFNPLDVLIAIAAGDSEALGTDEQIRIFERRAASQEVLSYIAPKLKPKEAPITDDDMPDPIPVFLGRRDIAGLNKQEAEEEKQMRLERDAAREEESE